MRCRRARECEGVHTSLLKGSEPIETSDLNGVDWGERPVYLANKFHVWPMLLMEIGSTGRISTGSTRDRTPPSVKALRTNGEDGTRKGFVKVKGVYWVRKLGPLKGLKF